MLDIKIVVRYVMVWQSNVLPPSSGKSLSYSRLWRELCSLAANVGSLNFRNVLMVVVSCPIADCWNDKWNRTTPDATVVTISAANCSRCTVCWYDSLLNLWGTLCSDCTVELDQLVSAIYHNFHALPLELQHSFVLLYSRVCFFMNNLDW
jgi:hypothetical protein